MTTSRWEFIGNSDFRFASDFLTSVVLLTKEVELRVSNFPPSTPKFHSDAPARALSHSSRFI
jgi:hypothetical protein